MFKMRILIILVMLIKCAADDIRTGYVSLKIIISATAIALIFRIFEDVASTEKNNHYTSYIPLILIILFFFLMNCETIHRTLRKTENKTKNKTQNKTQNKKENLKNIDDYIGRGDLYIFVSIMVVFGIDFMITVAAASFLFSSFYSMYLVIAKHKGREYGFPFVPFILVGFIVGTI